MKKNTLTLSRSLAFTLVELLVVIAIIAILASLLLPAIGRVKIKARVGQAKADIKALEGAIGAYKGEYSRFPSTNVTSGLADSTFGYSPADNSQVMVILRDVRVGVNLNSARNPRRHNFLTGVKDVPNATSPGVGTDNTYRDPWGNPYVISMDTGFDGLCRDSVYGLQAVSQFGNNSSVGLFGTFNNTDPSGNGDNFVIRTEVAVWSAGPDGFYNTTQQANTNQNKDNILSWNP